MSEAMSEAMSEGRERSELPDAILYNTLTPPTRRFAPCPLIAAPPPLGPSSPVDRPVSRGPQAGRPAFHPSPNRRSVLDR